MRPDILPPTAVTTAVNFPNNKFLKFLWVIKDVYIGLLRPDTLPQVIVEVVDIDILRPATLYQVIADDVILMMLVEVDLSYKRPATLPPEIG